ncbi:MAG: hypothetical protein LBH08_00835 [Puniceicoccales bacterium]|jgi:hypothetical protein|nr:hypothetical protein [Puniceicoccales bacterium]
MRIKEKDKKFFIMLNKKIIIIGGLLSYVSFDALLNSSTIVKEVSLFAESEDSVLSHRSEPWIGQLSEEEVQAINQAFPNLGFALALFIVQAKKNSAGQIFDNDSLVSFYPGSGCCQDMRKGTFQGKTYILKSKNSVEQPRMFRRKLLNAQYEAESGVRIRQMVIDIFLDRERNLDEILIEFAYLKYLTAPIDCIDYTASLEVPNAIPLHDILYVDRRQISFTSVAASSDIPVPNFSLDDEVLIPRKTLFPDMNFGEVEERIRMAQNILKVMEFLHSCGIAHNDLHSGNFLVSENDYTQIALIDFDNARFQKQFFIADRKGIVDTMGRYLFGTTGKFDDSDTEDPDCFMKIDDSYMEDPETFSYNLEELNKIKKILSSLPNDYS